MYKDKRYHRVSIFSYCQHQQNMAVKQKTLLALGIFIFTSIFLISNVSRKDQEEAAMSKPFKLVLDPDCGCRKVRNMTEIPLKLRSTCSQRATDRGKGQKAISYSFYGALDSAYFNGIAENLAGVALLYPEYIMRLYYNRREALEAPEKFAQLCDYFCKQPNFDLCDVNEIGKLIGILLTPIWVHFQPYLTYFKPNLAFLTKFGIFNQFWRQTMLLVLEQYPVLATKFGMVWRFAPMADTLVSEWHCRDLDSRISPREISAVQDWQSSGATYHIMRDNPFHVAPIVGCCFGMRNNNKQQQQMKSDFQAMLDYVKTTWMKGLDQTALSVVVWPHAQKDMIAHDSYLCQVYINPNNRPWPTQRIAGDNFTFPEDLNFVGSNGGKISLQEQGECPIKCRPSHHQNWLIC
jgi:hypothetical protein